LEDTEQLLIAVRVPGPVHEAIVASALANDRSIVAEARRTLTRAYAAPGGPAAHHAHAESPRDGAEAA